jgi:peptidoglycan/LPS O-acetylase OafA/YrhL
VRTRSFASSFRNRAASSRDASSSTPAGRIQGFDGLRALAVLCVWLEHRTFLNGTGIGGAGVSLFFVLSGFLIVGILAHQRQRVESGVSTTGAELKAFLARRALRIVPVYALFLCALGLGWMAGGRPADWASSAMHVLYLVNFQVALVTHVWNATSTHLWSLAVEEQFYLVFPFIALWTPASRQPVTCTILTVSLLLGGAYIFDERPLFAILALLAYAKIATGGLFVLASRGRARRDGNASLAILAFLALYAMAHVGARVGGGMPALAQVLLHVAVPLLAGCILLSVRSNPSSRVVRALELAPIRSFGRISYGFYVYHYPFDDRLLARMLPAQLREADMPWLNPLLEFAIPLALAALSWRIVEKPLLSLHRGAGMPARLAPAAA